VASSMRGPINDGGYAVYYCVVCCFYVGGRGGGRRLVSCYAEEVTTREGGDGRGNKRKGKACAHCTLGRLTVATIR